MAMIDVYGISESGKRVKVGQVDEGQVLPGYSVTFNLINISARASIQINDGETQAYNSITSGTTLTGVETITIYCITGGSWKVYPYTITSTSQEFGISVDGGAESIITSGSGDNYAGYVIIIRLTGNTTFSDFTVYCDKLG